jgi:DNA repair exonuclease SbcCD ATPase subunit
VAFLVAGLAAGSSDLRYLSLLDIPAFGWSAWLAWHWIDAREAFGKIGRRGRLVDDWEAKVQAQFAKDAGALQAALKTLGLGKPSELKEALERLAAADQGVAEAKQRLQEWEADAQTTDALAERARVEEEMRAVETRLSEQAGGFVRDVQSVEAELARVEAEAAAPPAPAPAPAPAPRPAAAAGGEPLRGLLERAAAELGGSPASVARGLAARASQAVAGFTLNRLTAVSADDRGNVQVTSGGRAVPAMTLPPGERDLVFLALKVALLEQALAGGRSVALLEDAFAGLSDGVRRTGARLLKALAKPGQVIHATTDPAFREAADHQT